MVNSGLKGLRGYGDALKRDTNGSSLLLGQLFFFVIEGISVAL